MAPQPVRRPWLMLPVAAAVIGWQVWAVAGRGLHSFQLSYWFVTWDHGFIRRGLLGEVNQLFFAGDLLMGARVLTLVVAGLSAASFVGVAVLLLRQGSATAVGLGWLLLVSPFTVKGMLNFSRPDQLAVPLIVLVGAVWVLLPRRPAVGLAALGLVFGVLVLAHEAVVLICAPWIVLLVVHFSAAEPRRVLVGRLGVFFAVPAVTSLVVIASGPASPGQVRALEAEALPILPDGNHLIRYLDEPTLETIRKTFSYGVVHLAVMILVGTALWLLHLAALALVPGIRRVPPRDVTVVLVAVVVPSFGLLLAAAVDWQRWFALWAALGLLTYGVVLAVRPPAPARWTPLRLAGFIACCAVLVMVPVSTANNKAPCSWDFLVREAPYPYQRVVDLVAGEEHRYRIIKCPA